MKRPGNRIRIGTHHNPVVSNLVPLALIAGGAYLLLRKQDGAGMGGFGSKFKAAVSAPAAAVANVVKTVTAPVVATVAAATKSLPKAAVLLTAPLAAGGALLTVGASALVNKSGGAQEAAPAQDGGTVYQDENGKPITEAEYNRRMAEMAAAQKAASEPVYQDANGNPITKAQYDLLLAQLRANGVTTPPFNSTTVAGAPILRLPPLPPPAPVVVPQPVSWQPDYTYSLPPTQQAPPVSYTSPGGASPSDYSLPPAYTPPTQQAAAPAYAPIQAAPSDAKKINPVLAVGVLAAVPLLAMLGAK